MISSAENSFGPYHLALIVYLLVSTTYGAPTEPVTFSISLERTSVLFDI